MKFLKYFESIDSYDIDGLFISGRYLTKDQLVDILQDILDDFNVYRINIGSRIITTEKRRPFPYLLKKDIVHEYSKNGFIINLIPFKCTQDEVENGYPNLYLKYKEIYDKMENEGYLDQLNDRLNEWKLKILKSLPFKNSIHIEIIELNSDPSNP